MTVFQIIAVCILGAGTLVALGFLTAFIVVCVKKEKPQVEVVKEEVERPPKRETLKELFKDRKQKEVEPPKAVETVSEEIPIEQVLNQNPDKKISRIVIFYSDRSFVDYRPE